MEKAVNNRAGPPLNIVPYKNNFQQDYSSTEYTPLKLGDLFLLNMAWDKNNSTPYYVVSKVPEVPLGINFDDRLVGARKVGVRRTSSNMYYFSFDAIRLILDGNTKEAKDFLSQNESGTSNSRFIRGIFENNYPIRLKPNSDLFGPDLSWDDFMDVEDEFKAFDPHTSPHASTYVPEINDDSSMTRAPSTHTQKRLHKTAKKSRSRTVGFKEKLDALEKSDKKEKHSPVQTQPSWLSLIPGSSLLPRSNDTLKILTDNLMTPIYRGPTTRSRSKNPDIDLMNL